MKLPQVTNNSNPLNYTAPAALFAGEMSGIPIRELALPDPMYALYTGAITSGIAHHGGFNFAGMFGYKTLFSGQTGRMSTFTMGNAVLSAIEAVGSKQWANGNRSGAVAAMRNARQIGLTGIMSSQQFGSLDEATKAADMMRKQGNAGASKLLRFMGGQGSEVDNVIISGSQRFTPSQAAKTGRGVMKSAYGGKPINQTFTVMAKNSATNFVAGGKVGSYLGRGFSAFAWAQMASIPLEWLGRNVLNKASEHIGELTDVVHNRNFNMGRGYLSPSFQTQQAATERQRAVQAIYGSRVNPSSRVFGNEASYMHRN